jgi:glutamate N-acetyltransferase/amino-acid N-acetyltransferase
MTFFRSRWVERPSHVTEVEPTALPRGFRAGAAAAGIQPEGRLDVGLLVSDEPETTSAARFCASGLLGAPVIVSQQGALDRLRAVVTHAGNANVADGERGLGTARAAQAEAAERLGVEREQVGLAGTGVIGRELPRDRLVSGVGQAVDALGEDAEGMSQAILTTDRGPKRACIDVTLPSGQVRVAVQGKGAGMLQPRFATMFCFLETDAAVPADALDLLCRVTVARSFERTSVDAQLSTSDTVFFLANGTSGVRVEPESPDELALGEAIDALLRQLAIEMVADGEGATRVGRVVVRGGADAVEPVARAVANSPLVKTALYGADPNFGRILQAAGMALTGYEPFAVDLEVEGRVLVSGGAAVDQDEKAWKELEEAVRAPEIEYELTLPGDGGETEVFFSDLTHDYVKLNAEYTS